MSTTLDDDARVAARLRTRANADVRAARRRQTLIGAEPPPLEPVATRLTVDQDASHRMGRVFNLLLGAAALLTVLGVVAQARATSENNDVSVNGPAPAVFVQSD